MGINPRMSLHRLEEIKRTAKDRDMEEHKKKMTHMMMMMKREPHVSVQYVSRPFYF